MKTWVHTGVVSLSCVAIAWAVTQSRSLSEVRERNEILRDRLAGQSPGSDAPQFFLPKGPVDWKSLSGKIGWRLSDIEGTKARMALSARFLEAGPEEIAGELEALNATDVGYSHKESFAWQAIRVLAEKDPELALRRFARGFDTSDGVPLYPLAVALRNWARKDPAAAAEWFGAEVAAGTFIGKRLSENGGRESVFERQLLTALVDSDSAMARARIRAMGQDRAKDVLWQIDSTQVGLAAYANLVRSALDKPSDRARTLAVAARPFAERQGYADATRFIEETGASGEERVAIVENVVQTKRIASEGELRVMREWVRQQSPEGLGAMTGTALSLAASPGSREAGMSFDMAAGLAESYGGDDVLGAFLYSHAARANPKKATEMASGISDKALREKLVGYINR